MTPKERAAMQAAWVWMDWYASNNGTLEPVDLNETITALREALAEPQITTPDVCGEVCARAKLCYGCNKDLEEANAKYVEQAEQRSDSERMEPVADIVYDEFGPRIILRKSIKELPDGMQLFTAPVRTKDLTDDEIYELIMPVKPIMEFARAVIAADREKNHA